MSVFRTAFPLQAAEVMTMNSYLVGVRLKSRIHVNNDFDFRGFYKSLLVNPLKILS
jgi:hypothetical protein